MPVNLHPTDDLRDPDDRASVLDVDGPIDLAVIAVPAAAVLDVARRVRRQGCARARRGVGRVRGAADRQSAPGGAPCALPRVGDAPRRTQLRRRGEHRPRHRHERDVLAGRAHAGPRRRRVAVGRGRDRAAGASARASASASRPSCRWATRPTCRETTSLQYWADDPSTDRRGAVPRVVREPPSRSPASPANGHASHAGGRAEERAERTPASAARVPTPRRWQIPTPRSTP